MLDFPAALSMDVESVGRQGRQGGIFTLNFVGELVPKTYFELLIYFAA
jgi:hypothetical protein